MKKSIKTIREELDRDGISILKGELSSSNLLKMKIAFESQLFLPRFNTSSGYQQNEKWRFLIEDLLTLSQEFYFPIYSEDLISVIRGYIGNDFQMTEARGWKTISTTKNFHGWHNDAWYDEAYYSSPPAQLKLGVYLTDVESGEFVYVKGSHLLKYKPIHMNDRQVKDLRLPIEFVTGSAGTIFLFDTSGIHRQNTPVLKSRNAVFYNFHDPSIKLQNLDLQYNRYSPLLLNASFLKNLNKEQERILGFGDTRYYSNKWYKEYRFKKFHRLVSYSLTLLLELNHIKKSLLRYKRFILFHICSFINFRNKND